MHDIAIFGAGTMGTGIAISCLVAGLPVALIDSDAGALDRAAARIDRYLERQIEKGRMDAAGARTARTALRTETDPAAASTADLVIEAVFEDLEVKRGLFARVEPLLRPEAVLATNTSCLIVGDVGAGLDRPDRLLGLHYFSPAEISPIVELVSTARTDPGVTAAALGFLERTGKQPLPCRDSPGFALNRFFCPYCNEAVRCLEDGLGSTGQIDLVARETFQLPIGPFAVMNITKPRVMLQAERSLARFGAFYAPAALLEARGLANTDWPIEPEPAPLARDAGLAIAERLMGAVLLASGAAVAEGVAEPLAIDRGASIGLRFGRAPGALAAELGDEETRRLIAGVARPTP